MKIEATPNSTVKNSIFRKNKCLISDSNMGLIECQVANLEFSECIFLENTAKCIFTAFNKGNITVIHCFGDNITAIGFGGGIMNTNEMKTQSFNISFPFYSMIECKIESQKPFEHKNKKGNIFKNIFSSQCFINLKR